MSSFSSEAQYPRKVPGNDSNVEKAYFNVDLSLPQPSKASNLGALITDLPTFNQSFDNLSNLGYLQSFIVQGSVGSITADVRSYLLIAI